MTQYSALVIEAAVNGGFTVRQAPYDNSVFHHERSAATALYASTTYDEAAAFVKKNILGGEANQTKGE